MKTALSQRRAVFQALNRVLAGIDRALVTVLDPSGKAQVAPVRDELKHAIGILRASSPRVRRRV